MMNKNIGQSVTKKEILEYLKAAQGELTDAYNTAPDTPETSDSLYYINTAQDLRAPLVNSLKNQYIILWII